MLGGLKTSFVLPGVLCGHLLSRLLGGWHARGETRLVEQGSEPCARFSWLPATIDPELCLTDYSQVDTPSLRYKSDSYSACAGVRHGGSGVVPGGHGTHSVFPVPKANVPTSHSLHNASCGRGLRVHIRTSQFQGAEGRGARVGGGVPGFPGTAHLGREGM